MSYTTVNFRTKKALKDAVKNGESIGVFQPGPFGPGPDQPFYSGEYSVEGPHYPEPHKWYARVTVREGHIIKVT